MWWHIQETKVLVLFRSVIELRCTKILIYHVIANFNSFSTILIDWWSRDKLKFRCIVNFIFLHIICSICHHITNPFRIHFAPKFDTLRTFIGGRMFEKYQSMVLLFFFNFGLAFNSSSNFMSRNATIAYILFRIIFGALQSRLSLTVRP